MSEFTPGKWTADGYGCYVFAHGEDMMICNMRGDAYLRNHGQSDEEIIAVQDANARLIAAAPELYELVMDELRGEAGGILSFAREAKIKAVLDRIDGKEEQV